LAFLVIKGEEMQSGPPRRRRARPVADAPIDALLLRAEDLTKGWLLALLEQEPLSEAPSILAAELTRDGPRLCDAIVRALGDDEDLRRLAPGGALEALAGGAGQLAGAVGVEATARAVDALGEVIWSAIRGELPAPEPDQITELAERLSLVMGQVRAAALRRSPGEALSDPERGDAPRPEVEHSRRAGDSSPAPLSLVGQSGSESGGAGWPADTEPAVGGARTSGPPRRDEVLWIGALEDEIRRSKRTGGPLSLLLVELDDAERVVAADGAEEASATFGRFAQALRTAVRRQDILACETQSRAWVIARETGRVGALALGDRIVEAVRSANPWRGAPLTVNVGLAVFGEDGLDPEELIASAEESMFFAAASGSGVADGGRSRGPDGPAGPRLVS
jgi:GGDEF domain-containing protein